ncbi:sec-independent protein translocase protein TatC [Dysgonomonas sp. PFB1-18]|uniref:twin-arginine translocase subunit TatC n=1 Tax=unclassified Dysgonomonas TaxID=2630389 RepID=UPI002475FED3|nr:MULTISPECIES: twin-arginine translocase subunit TatC [unclassified Dysgonomonas]MDH6308943.1 sec-independent protein translocase protein TatC [Dysgonomonas sp. PF1-14]MDH6338694.1 sec-independent protein translocase protein TatC [Dysgonomonas sp. PF1-16]MDH6380278.1 sec-independent protein translocase protein TatC [Dysgonomonas sp. PFB1-18]MDH6397608.1 sec-independent protein translocase protein TatC [Dysgonomonas sp. PF1-23]
MEETNDGMTFWDHLEELRWTLIRSIIALLIFAIAGFAAMPYIYDSIIMGPTNANFFLYEYLCKVTSAIPFLPDFCDDTFHVNIININLTSQFFRHMTTSFWLALILTFPYLVFEIWRFVSPALYESEKKSIRWVFLFGTIMFFIGCTVGYSLVFPITFRFLATYQLSDTIVNQISLDSYMDNFLMLVFIMGIVFELPLLSWLLSQLGLLNRSFFKKFRRHAIVGLLVLSAIITPSGDPFTLSVVFVPLYLLYELSAFFVKPAPEETDEDEEETDIAKIEE